jgi:hypothetical protein
MPTPNQRPKPWGVVQEHVERQSPLDPRADHDPPSTSTPIARVALKSSPAEGTPVEPPPESVVERLLNEVLSDIAPRPEGSCEAHRRRIEELEALVAAKEKRVGELELLLAQEGGADILQHELEATRAHSSRLEECVARLTKERDRLQAIAAEAEVLRSSVDYAAAEAEELEHAVHAERTKSETLAAEVALLRSSVEGLRRP